jgi:hypothetical protein
MVEDRLTLIAPDLSKKLRQAQPDTLRKVLLSVCRFALDRAKLTHPTVENVLLSLENGKALDSSSRQKLKTLAESLDERYFELDAAFQEDSTVDRTAALAAFRQARAVNAICLAADDNVVQSAPECLYEANAAIGDIETLKKLVAAYIA